MCLGSRVGTARHGVLYQFIGDVIVEYGRMFTFTKEKERTGVIIGVKNKSHQFVVSLTSETDRDSINYSGWK